MAVRSQDWAESEGRRLRREEVRSHIAGAVEHHTDRGEGLEEGLEEEHRNLTAAAVPRMIDNHPVEGMGCYSAEDNVLVEDVNRFQVVPQGHRRSRRSHLEMAGIAHPEEDKDYYFEGDILETEDTGLELADTGLELDTGLGQAGIGLGIGQKAGIGCTSRSLA